MRWSVDWQMKHFLSRFSWACIVRAILIWRLPSPPRASSRKLGMNSPSSPSWVDSPPKWSSSSGREGPGSDRAGSDVSSTEAHEGRGFMEARFIARSLGRSPLMTNGRVGTFPLEAFVAGNVGFVFLYCLVHLVWGQLAMPGYLGV